MFRHRHAFRRRRIARRRPMGRRRHRRINQRSRTRRQLRQGTKFFCRLHNFQVVAVPAVGYTTGVSEIPALNTSNWPQLALLAENWQHMRVWKAVVTITPNANAIAVGSEVYRHAIAPYYQTLTSYTSPVTNYAAVTSLPQSKATAGYNKLSISFVPKSPITSATVATANPGGVILSGGTMGKRPLLNCAGITGTVGSNYMPALYGWIYGHEGLNSATTSISIDTYLYCTFYNYQGNVI